MSDPSAKPEPLEPLEPLAEELNALVLQPSDRPPSIAPPGPPPLGPVINFKDVSISFNGRPVLKDVTFNVDRGETLCILGRSGVGNPSRCVC